MKAFKKGAARIQVPAVQPGSESPPQPPPATAQQLQQRCVELEWKAKMLSQQRERALNELADAQCQIQFASQLIANLERANAEQAAEIKRLQTQSEK